MKQNLDEISKLSFKIVLEFGILFLSRKIIDNYGLPTGHKSFFQKLFEEVYNVVNNFKGVHPSLCSLLIIIDKFKKDSGKGYCSLPLTCPFVNIQVRFPKNSWGNSCFIFPEYINNNCWHLIWSFWKKNEFLDRHSTLTDFWLKICR